MGKYVKTSRPEGVLASSGRLGQGEPGGGGVADVVEVDRPALIGAGLGPPQMARSSCSSVRDPI
jgi:hypothetical protein